MLSCKKASELIEKKSVVKLSVKENMMLHMHTAMCDGCKAYQKQSKLLDKFLLQHTHLHTEENIPIIENEALKKKIINKL